MPYKGHVEKGVIILGDPVSLKDGTTVAVEVTVERAADGRVTPGSRYEHYRSVIGALDDMPEDWAENHDKYLCVVVAAEELHQ